MATLLKVLCVRWLCGEKRGGNRVEDVKRLNACARAAHHHSAHLKGNGDDDVAMHVGRGEYGLMWGLSSAVVKSALDLSLFGHPGEQKAGLHSVHSEDEFSGA